VARAVLAAVAFYAVFVAVAIPAEWVQGQAIGAGTWWRTAGRGLIGLAAPPLVAVGLVYAGLVWGAGQRPETWGVRSCRQALAGAGLGLGWGITLAALTILLCLAGGATLRRQSASDERALAVALPLAAGLAGAALLEELLFRGFPLSRLARGVGRVAAAVLLAVVFGWAHLRNPEMSGIGLANIGLASLLLAAAFFTGGGLGTAAGLHLGWNAGLVFGADAPVSGLRFGVPGLEFVPGPQVWWTGGSFGPEGGLAATLVLGAALAWWARAAALEGEQREREVAA
jgi:membrane protease YdiL (CAAX protease family)